MRIGHGYDVHKLVEDRLLILGGEQIPYKKGLLGHSDADVLVHAGMDALLGAAAMHDIGYHFPDTDERFKDADSMMLLREVIKLLKNEGYKVVNIDATVIAQAPKLKPFIENMRENITFRRICDKEGRVLAGLNINNMIPVPEKYLTLIFQKSQKIVV